MITTYKRFTDTFRLDPRHITAQYGDLDGGLEAAARWFRLAAEAGIAAAQYELGVALVNGDGVAMDRREGVDWLQKAAIQGKAEAIADLESESGVLLRSSMSLKDVEFARKTIWVGRLIKLVCIFYQR